MEVENYEISLIDAVLFLMMMDYPEIKKFKIDELFSRIVSDEWTWNLKNVKIDELSDSIEEHEHLFEKKDDKICLSDEGISKAMEVNYY